MDKMLIVAIPWFTTIISCVILLAILRLQLAVVVYFHIFLAHFGGPIFRLLFLPIALALTLGSSEISKWGPEGIPFGLAY